MTTASLYILVITIILLLITLVGYWIIKDSYRFTLNAHLSIDLPIFSLL